MQYKTATVTVLTVCNPNCLLLSFSTFASIIVGTVEKEAQGAFSGKMDGSSEASHWIGFIGICIVTEDEEDRQTLLETVTPECMNWERK